MYYRIKNTQDNEYMYLGYNSVDKDGIEEALRDFIDTECDYTTEQICELYGFEIEESETKFEDRK